MKPSKPLTCFKAYDIRGKLGIDLDEIIAYRIARSTVQSLRAKSIVLGFDARETSPKLADSAAKGICDAGADVMKIGLAGTEEMYCAVSTFNADAGIEITASHNPINYNGMKIVKYGSQPLSQKEFFNIKNLAEENRFVQLKNKGLVLNKKNEAKVAYLRKVLSFVDLERLGPLKIVINSGNGTAGPVVDSLIQILDQKGINADFVLVDHIPDSTFPNGIPNPLLEENWPATADVVKKCRADFGVAFDGDFDRCFLFDNFGNFVSGEYVVGILCNIFLKRQIGATIVHDSRVIWNILDIVDDLGGYSHASKTGHAFVKSKMRETDAIYGGERSAHHYFRDFDYCDSGMIPWLLVWELLSQKNISLAELVSERKKLFPSSTEINFKVSDAPRCLSILKNHFVGSASDINEDDGLSMSFGDWRFNIRNSNTEPLVRLSVETKENEKLLIKKIRELSELIAKA